ncbi:MAG: hypothetical protein JWN15_561 [Firmicutes bacterium]|nr:hypothetical protein [Bacillota bacterium]
MTTLIHEEITKEILGAGFAVHGALGPGFLESIYEEALAHELQLRGLSFERQIHIPIHYKTVLVGEHVLDLMVEDKVVVELKAISELVDVHRAIAVSYLAASRRCVALLLNFGQPSMQFKRVVRQTQPG